MFKIYILEIYVSKTCNHQYNICYLTYLTTKTSHTIQNIVKSHTLTLVHKLFQTLKHLTQNYKVTSYYIYLRHS